jgi:hypothetical protein
MVALFLGISIPLFVLAALSGLSKGNSTHAQRVWTMCRLAFGSVANIFSYYNPETSSVLDSISVNDAAVLSVMPIYVAPAIGGFVVVSKMIYEQGICTKMIV